MCYKSIKTDSMDPLESFTISAEVLEQFDWDYNYEEHLLNF